MRCFCAWMARRSSQLLNQSIKLYRVFRDVCINLKNLLVKLKVFESPQKSGHN